MIVVEADGTAPTGRERLLARANTEFCVARDSSLLGETGREGRGRPFCRRHD